MGITAESPNEWHTNTLTYFAVASIRLWTRLDIEPIMEVVESALGACRAWHQILPLGAVLLKCIEYFWLRGSSTL